MIKITVDNIKDYIFAKAMIESFSESEKLYYRLSTEFLNIEDPEVDIIKSENYYKGEDGLKTEVATEMLYSKGIGTRKSSFQDQFDYLTSNKDLYDIKLRGKIVARGEDDWKELIKQMNEDSEDDIPTNEDYYLDSAYPDTEETAEEIARNIIYGKGTPYQGDGGSRSL